MADVQLWFAVASGGASLRIGPLGLVVGRHPSCDLVLEDPRVSRRHLLLQPDGDRIKAVALVEGGTILNGRVLDAPVEVDANDVLTLPDGTALQVRPVDASEAQATQLAIELTPGQSIALRAEQTTIGGAWQDDIVIDGWPASAIRLVSAQRLSLIAGVDGIVVAGRTIARDDVVILALGDAITAYGRTLRVIVAAPPDETTIAAQLIAPRRIVLELLPTGGRLTVHAGVLPRVVMLSERRFALAMALLVPAAPQQAGEFIGDDELFARIWPRQVGVDRGDLNQLVHRLRGDLTGAGLDGARLVERLAQGGGTRFVVDAGTTIERRG